MGRTRTIRGMRQGQALLEFALIALVLGLLLGGMLSLGTMFFAAHAVQIAADVGAQELARLPLPATALFDDPADPSNTNTALADADVKLQIYDERFLVIDVNTPISSLPLVNRLLYPVMFVDPDLGMRRYPGALATNANGDRTVLIPVVTGRDPGSGAETITWRRVVEEVRSDPDDGHTGSFSVNAPSSAGVASGIVSLRINYPFQAAGLVSYLNNGDGTVTASLANDAAVSESGLPQGYTLVDASSGAGVYAGKYGLGSLSALNVQVRPYRKLISAQGVYRREVFK